MPVSELSMPADKDSWAGEAQRQRELIAAIFAPEPTDLPCSGVRQTGSRWQAGLAAYRGNGLGHARNALREQFPTLLAMLGEAAFDGLCTRFWRTEPPRRGDLAWAGDKLADFVDSVEELQNFPWLSDCARLDWAIWLAAGAARPRLNEEDFRRLAAGDPQCMRLQLARGVSRLKSDWPVVTLFLAHREPDPDWAAVRGLLESGQAETALVWRMPETSSPMEPPVVALDETTDRWIVALMSAASIETALDQAGSDFDFTAWLEIAVQQGWLEAVIEHAGQDSNPGAIY